MVLRLKSRESRSLPVLPRTDVRFHKYEEPGRARNRSAGLFVCASPRTFSARASRAERNLAGLFVLAHTVPEFSGDLSMRVFDFNRAIVREPGQSVVHGLRENALGAPTHDGIAAQHRTYVAALREAGVEVDVLPPLEDFPDSVFVEDPALTFPEGAILLSPGAPSRIGERDPMRDALQHHFDRIMELNGDEYTDGGDILVTPSFVFIGMSKRTTRAGAEALARKLEVLGRKARIAQTPPSILHFKTASALLSEDSILATKALADSGVFSGFNVLLVPDGEEGAANALRVNDTVLVGDIYPRTAQMLAKQGFSVRTVPVSEVVKLDAGLSCMSLRWHSR
jgi:dimethylargininase